jgi:hypothetical protein
MIDRIDISSGEHTGDIFDLNDIKGTEEKIGEPIFAHMG